MLCNIFFQLSTTWNSGVVLRHGEIFCIWKMLMWLSYFITLKYLPTLFSQTSAEEKSAFCVRIPSAPHLVMIPMGCTACGSAPWTGHLGGHLYFRTTIQCCILYNNRWCFQLCHRWLRVALEFLIYSWEWKIQILAGSIDESRVIYSQLWTSGRQVVWLELYGPYIQWRKAWLPGCFFLLPFQWISCYPDWQLVS